MKLEETYFDKIELVVFDKPKGLFFQQVYTNKRRGLDEIVRVSNNNIFLVPKDYHPVVMETLYKNYYYFNFLASSDQSLANIPDPSQEWNSKNGKNIPNAEILAYQWSQKI